MDEPIITEEYKGYTIKVFYDLDPRNPREDGTLGHMACWHRRYVLGDPNEVKHGVSPEFWNFDLAYRLDEDRISYWDAENDRRRNGAEEQLAKAIADTIHKYCVILPLYLMDHSGISISTTSVTFRAFDSHGWDWGQIGWIYVTKKEALQEWKRKHWSKKLEEEVRKELCQEVEVYDAYLCGDVYYSTVLDADGEYVDSCDGYTGPNEEQRALEQARAIVDYEVVKKIQSYKMVPS